MYWIKNMKELESIIGKNRWGDLKIQNIRKLK